MFLLTKEFRFDAAHTLERYLDTASSRRVHGHSYRAEVSVVGSPDAQSGMIIDLAEFERQLTGVRDLLDHHLLNEISGLGPATLENLASWIFHQLAPHVVGLVKVQVYRDSYGESCTYKVSF